MGLQDMPNEISVQILRYLPQNSLTSVSLSFKWFHQFVEPILYSTLVQRGRTAIPLLIRTIVDKPQLGRHFKTVHLLDIRKAFSGKQLGENVLTPEYHKKIRDQINAYVSAGGYKDFYRNHRDDLREQQIVQEWCTNIFERKLNFEATASFLLLLLPNLEQFSLEKYEICYENVLSVLSAAPKMQRSEHSIHNVGSLSRLRVLRLHISDDYGHLVPTITMVRMAEIPSLHEFSCDGIRESSTVRVKHEPTIRKLSLMNSQVRLSQLKLILPSFKHLQNLTIEFSDLWGSPLTGDNVFPTVIKCIVQSQSTLEQLKIINSKHRGRVTGEEFPPLASFIKLRVMEIEGDFLNHPHFTFAQLPTALENLTLRNSDKENILRHLTVNLRELRAVPGLVNIEVQIRRHVRDWVDEENLNILLDEFEDRGIALRVGPVPSF